MGKRPPWTPLQTPLFIPFIRASWSLCVLVRQSEGCHEGP